MIDSPKVYPDVGGFSPLFPVLLHIKRRRTLALEHPHEEGSYVPEPLLFLKAKPEFVAVSSGNCAPFSHTRREL